MGVGSAREQVRAHFTHTKVGGARQRRGRIGAQVCKTCKPCVRFVEVAYYSAAYYSDFRRIVSREHRARVSRHARGLGRVEPRERPAGLVHT